MYITAICELPLVQGDCEAYMPSYGFKDGACTKFVYGGCGGNGNRFRYVELSSVTVV